MKGEREGQLIDIVILQDQITVTKEKKKVNRYIDLASVISTQHKVKTKIVLLVIEALGSVFKPVNTYIDVSNIIDRAQISTITYTARFLRDVLSL